VFDFLASHRFAHIPALVKTKHGDSLVKTPQQYMMLMEYVGG
jgi:hypothetical protein